MARVDDLIRSLNEAGNISGLTLFHTGSGWQAGVQIHRTEGWHVGLARDPLEAASKSLEAAKRVADIGTEDDDLLGFSPQPEEEDLIG
jgi:hypothetical protein